MSLFQPSALKKYLSQQNSTTDLKAYKKYIKCFHNSTIQENIRKSKEKQFQKGFLKAEFIKVAKDIIKKTISINDCSKSILKRVARE